MKKKKNLLNPPKPEEPVFSPTLLIFFVVCIVIMSLFFVVPKAFAQESAIGDTFNKSKEKAIELLEKAKPGLEKFVATTEAEFAQRGRLAILYSTIWRDDTGFCTLKNPKLRIIFEVPKRLIRFREGRELNTKSDIGIFLTGLTARANQPRAQLAISELAVALGLPYQTVTLGYLEATLNQLRVEPLCELPSKTKQAFQLAAQVLANGTDTEQKAAGRVFSVMQN